MTGPKKTEGIESEEHDAKPGHHRHSLGSESGENPACPHPRPPTPIPRLLNKYNQLYGQSIYVPFPFTMADAVEAAVPNQQITKPATENGDGDSSTPPTEAEVQTIIASIAEVSSEPPSDTNEFDEGAYWDLSSMAPLNAVSAVSTYMSLRAQFNIFSIAALRHSRPVTPSIVQPFMNNIVIMRFPRPP